MAKQARQEAAERRLKEMRKLNGETYLELQERGYPITDYEVLMVRLEAVIEHFVPKDSPDRLNLEIYFEGAVSEYLAGRLRQVETQESRTG